jgi:4-diphosphocytidyl-2C-methyl-D-erythritol kinase
VGKLGEQAKIVNIMFTSEIPVPAGLGNGPNNGANILSIGGEAL